MNSFKNRNILMRFLTLLLTPILLLLPLAKTHNAGFNENLTDGGKVTLSDENESKEYRIKKVVIDVRTTCQRVRFAGEGFCKTHIGGDSTRRGAFKIVVNIALVVRKLFTFTAL